MKYIGYPSHADKQEAININDNQGIRIKPGASKSGG